MDEAPPGLAASAWMPRPPRGRRPPGRAGVLAALAWLIACLAALAPMAAAQGQPPPGQETLPVPVPRDPAPAPLEPQGREPLPLPASPPVPAPPSREPGPTVVEPRLPAPAPASRDLGPVTVEAFPLVVDVVDANPSILTPERLTSLLASGTLESWLAGEGDLVRQGAAADGESRLLLRVRVPGEGSLSCEVAGGEDDGECERLGQGPLQSAPGPRYALARYRPPAAFGLAPAARYEDFVEARDVAVRLTFRAPGRDPVQVDQTLKLARPPVVLAHGLFDNRTNLWGFETSWLGALEGALEEDGPADRLRRAGFAVFGLDYQRTNTDAFRVNKTVVWDGTGGIRDALNEFRRRGLAATRADVVGHSMGGLLARVYVSPEYESLDPPHRYRRPDNFGAGDVNRLVTLCTPHHGSDLAGILATLTDRRTDTVRAVVKADLDAVVAGPPLLFAMWWEGIWKGAVEDLAPGSEALRLIGETPVPSRAIACLADKDDLESDQDPDRVYRTRQERIAWLFYRAPGLLEAYLRASGRDEEARLLPLAIETQYRHWQEAFEKVPWLGRPGRTEIETRTHKQPLLLGLFARTIFGGDQHDYTVGQASQHGGLAAPHVVDVGRPRETPGILHSFAPRSPYVMARIVQALKGLPFAPFAPGLPAPAEQARGTDWSLVQDLREFAEEHGGVVFDEDEAIRHGGLVYAHAVKFREVARERGEIVLVRAVNPDATPLIEDHASTKPMAIKAKSADWGPQRGYLPVDQAYSKLARPGSGKDVAEEIAGYNCEAAKSLAPGPDGRRVADAAVLQLRDGSEVWRLREHGSGDPERDARCGPGEHAGYVERLRARFKAWPDGTGRPTVLRRDPQGTYLPGDPGAALPAGLRADMTDPLLVLVDPSTKRPLTADYDLLAIGVHPDRGGRRCEPPVVMDPVLGAVCPEQRELIRALNDAVRKGDCPYLGESVVHHGPENQYPKSPYVDYPVTVFEPALDGTSAAILSIKEGPRGFRDIHLKRYMARKRREGWILDPNPTAPGWRWESRRPYDEHAGWDDEDAEETKAPTTTEPSEVLNKACDPVADRETVTWETPVTRKQAAAAVDARRAQGGDPESLPVDVTEDGRTHRYYVKKAKSEEAAETEAAAAALGRELGVAVPGTRLHPDGGDLYVVSREVVGTKLKEMADTQVDRLHAYVDDYVIQRFFRAWLGDGDGHGDNLVIDQMGRLVALDFDMGSLGTTQAQLHETLEDAGEFLRATLALAHGSTMLRGALPRVAQWLLERLDSALAARGMYGPMRYMDGLAKIEQAAAILGKIETLVEDPGRIERLLAEAGVKAAKQVTRILADRGKSALRASIDWFLSTPRSPPPGAPSAADPDLPDTVRLPRGTPAVRP